jgi:very-short-patch-repair endonuclease
VIRFRNEEVLSDLASVVNRIRIAALEQEEPE